MGKSVINLHLTPARRKVFIDGDGLERFRTRNQLRAVQLVLHSSDFHIPLVDVAARIDERPEEPVRLCKKCYF